MSVWAIRVVCDGEPDPDNPAAEREADVLAEVGPTALPAQATPATRLAADEARGLPARIVALHRVDGAHPLEDVLDAVEARLGDRSFYRIETHVCHHDETPPRPCQPWQVARQFGDVPEGV